MISAGLLASAPEYSYGETVARGHRPRVGRPQGIRAAAWTNNRKQVCGRVLAQRVIASDGKLCGYGGGLEVQAQVA